MSSFTYSTDTCRPFHIPHIHSFPRTWVVLFFEMPGITDLFTLITYISLQSLLCFKVLSHDFDVKLFSHSLRSRGCSLVSIFTILQVEATVKAFPRCLHSYGLSPV